MGTFTGLKTAPIFGRGAFLDPGEYRVKIIKCLTHMSNAGKGLMFIAEMEILESNHENHPPGSKRSWVQKMTDHNVAFPALKEFVAAVSGVDKEDTEALSKLDEEIEELMEAAVGEENALAGMTVGLSTWHKPTKAGGTFTVHAWSVDESAYT